MRPLPKEPDSDDRKKKNSKSKQSRNKSGKADIDKPNISYPINFEHTVHVGFNADTGEFTVSSCNIATVSTPKRTSLLASNALVIHKDINDNSHEQFE